MNPYKVGKTIAYLRKQHKMTQSDLAARIGVTDKAISRWENGRGTPDISLLTNLAVALDIDIESLLEGNLTHSDFFWKGVLFLNYADTISGSEYINSIRIVEFQLSFFMLAGIKNITICGKNESIRAIKQIIGNGKAYGCTFGYYSMKEDEEEDTVISDINHANPVMIIRGLDFIYGKDLTKCFRRIIYNNAGITKLTDTTGHVYDMLFCNHAAWNSNPNVNLQMLERGMLSFPIVGRDDLYDATTILKTIEKHIGETVASLRIIAARRGFIVE